jgi:hypothetical protein
LAKSSRGLVELNRCPRADPPIFTALHPLVDSKMVDLLLELGASPNVRDVSGRTR